MQLRHLRVRNIRSYESGAVDFGPGTTLIAGDVGAGKTSLLYAVEMALFGTAEVDAAYLVRYGGHHAEAAVAFEDADHRYEIVRRFRRVMRKGRAGFEPEAISFSVDGEKTEYSATELRQRVIELLGFPDNPSPTAHSDLWRWAVYVPQERMRDILGARPQDRLETVRKALGLEKYRTAAENAQDLAADLRRTAGALRSEAELLRRFDEEFARASAEVERLQVDRVALDEAVARRDAALRTLEREVEELERVVRAAEADRRELESLRREGEADSATVASRARRRSEREAAASAIRRESEAAQGEAGELGERRAALETTEREAQRIRGELDSLRPELEALGQARADLAAAERRLAPAHTAEAAETAEAARLRLALERLLAEGPGHAPPEPVPEPLGELDRRLTELRRQEADALAAKTRSESALHEFEELLSAGTCPRCGQTVRPAEFEPHRADAAEASRAAGATYRAAVAGRERAEAERSARERYERSLERWHQVERERAAARSTLAAAETRAEAARAGVVDATHAVAEAAARRDRGAGAESEELRLRSRLTEREADRVRLVASVERARAADERSRTAASTLAGLEAEIARLDEESRELARRIDARTVRVEELGTLVASADGSATRRRDAEGRRSAAESARTEARRSVDRVDVQLDAALARRADAERGRSERARRVAEAAELEGKATWVGGPFREAVLTMEKKLLTHAQAAFERNFARYFAALIDDPALVAQADPTFTPGVTIEGEWTPAEALSGGERTSLALAFRLALAQVVRSLGNLKLETILLDEPTDGFSPEQVVRMGELLNELALPQVILVSHEEALSGIADRVVRVVKSGGRSSLEVGGASPAPESAEPESPRASPPARRSVRRARSG